MPTSVGTRVPKGHVHAKKKKKKKWSVPYRPVPLAVISACDLFVCHTAVSLSHARALTSSKSSSCEAAQLPSALSLCRTTSSRECSTIEGVEVTCT